MANMASVGQHDAAVMGNSTAGIDWNIPGSALHCHIQLKQLSGDPSRWDNRADPSPREFTRMAAPARPAAKAAKSCPRNRNRAERGPQIAFGGKIAMPKDESKPNPELDGASGFRVGKDKRLTGPQAKDPWLSDWQPKSKPSTPGPRKMASRKSFNVLINPPLEWEVVRTSHADLASVSATRDTNVAPQPLRKSNGSGAVPKEAPHMASAIPESASKPTFRATSKPRLAETKSPHTLTTVPTAANMTPSTSAMGSSLQSATSIVASPESDGNVQRPKELAMKKLARLRDARRSNNINKPGSQSILRGPPDIGLHDEAQAAGLKSPRNSLTVSQSFASGNPRPQSAGPGGTSLPRPSSKMSRTSMVELQPQSSGRTDASSNAEDKVSLDHRQELRSQGSLLKRTKQAIQVSNSKGAEASSISSDLQQQQNDAGTQHASTYLRDHGQQSSQHGQDELITGATGMEARMQDPSESEPSEQSLVKCEECGRSFNAAAYQRHAKVCAKVFKADRAAHAAMTAKETGKPDADDTQASKSQTVSLAQVANAGIARKGDKANAKTSRAAAEISKKTPKWKQQSSQLRAAMLAAHPQKFGQAAANFPGAVVEVEEDTRVPCPHCGRRFAELTAERHIPKCKETRHKAMPLKAGGGKAAHMRLEGPSFPGRKW